MSHVKENYGFLMTYIKWKVRNCLYPFFNVMVNETTVGEKSKKPVTRKNMMILVTLGH